MWTTTRQDMRRQNWVSNHFIVLLPMEQTRQNDYNENSTKEHIDNGDNPDGNKQNYLNVTDLNPQDLLEQYVPVDYDKKPYLGIVTDCDET